MIVGEGPVLITGGTSGIGLGIARALIRVRRPVAVIGRDTHKCEIASNIPREGCANPDEILLSAAIDTINQDSLAGFVRKILDHWGRIDGLVTSAGRLARGSILDLSHDEFAAAWRHERGRHVDSYTVGSTGNAQSASRTHSYDRLRTRNSRCPGTR